MTWLILALAALAVWLLLRWAFRAADRRIEAIVSTVLDDPAPVREAPASLRSDVTAACRAAEQRERDLAS